MSSVAVFLPLTFLRDETGRLFREFAVTVAAALTVSGFVAVTLSPALCALVVRPQRAEHGLKAIFARFFDRICGGLRRARSPPCCGARDSGWAWAAAWVVLGVVLLPLVPQELIPKSDRSTMLVFTQAPEGSTIEYMDRYQSEAEHMLRALPEVERVFSVIALGIGTPGLVNQGVLIASLSDTDKRERSQQQLVNDVRPMLEGVAGITAFPTSPSMISGFGASPVQFVIEGDDLPELARWGDEIKNRIAGLRRLRQRADEPLSEQAAARGLDRSRPRQRPRRLGALDRERLAGPARRSRPLDVQARRRDLRRDGAARAAGAQRSARPARALRARQPRRS